jgi:hypothetical protein
MISLLIVVRVIISGEIAGGIECDTSLIVKTFHGSILRDCVYTIFHFINNTPGMPTFQINAEVAEGTEQRREIVRVILCDFVYAAHTKTLVVFC